jgi:hypothetical protein
MTRQVDGQNILKVKTALAEKYERRARSCRSKPARARLQHHAERFRQQAFNAENGLRD